MYSLGNDVYITRGEAWTYDSLIVNKDGSPYVVSNQYPNPYFLFKMASVNYQVNERFYDEIWCPIPATSTFYRSEPYELTSFLDDFSVSDLPAEIQQEIQQKGLTAANYSVYFVEEGGVKIYKQWTGTEWKDYSCPFILVFMSADTKKWKAQSYLYKLAVVSGQDIDPAKPDISKITHNNHIVEGQIIVAGNLDTKGGAQ
uniref:Uncharacterized protein n=1 Tax=Podoviridae sp. ctaNW81 TaxID=2826562 RepID=A0A8S5M655_9CAUD|nr:MAG TPA: hypothetical protein [Podoviridae sp. ctaNW81]